MIRSLLLIFLVLFTWSSGHALDITCTLRHSAVAEIDDTGSIDVHTSSSDSINVSITGIGGETAMFNKLYPLKLVKKGQDAIYYQQAIGSGMVFWVYHPKAHALTYAKLRSFPVIGSPASYLMVAKCD